MLLLGNLLSFYEQQRVFEEQGEALRPYNLDRPLWVFVGSTVNAVYTEGKQRRSDVLTVARFFHHLLENRGGWAVRAIHRLMEGKTGLATPDGGDVFEGRFTYLQETGLSPEKMYQDILEKVLRTPAAGGLHLCSIRGSAGELGLKASSAENYFGLIYIGDTSTFKKLAEADDSGITLEEDAIAGSLFQGISAPDTTINVLIGAKKFMEGWNSWRVSNMGLLNIGRKEGSEIIQLFGRGVRLRGRDFSLKRSAALEGSHPRHAGLLETLNIFAVRANYMVQFRDYLEREGIETTGDVRLPLEIRCNEDFLGRGLVVPRVPAERSFVREAHILLEPDPSVRVRVDMSLKVQAIESAEGGLKAFDMRAGEDVPIPNASLDLVDWEKAYLDLLEYKERKGLINLAIRPESPRKIVAASDPVRLYTLVAADPVIRPRSFADTALLQDATISILRAYVDKFYRLRQERWDAEHMVYRPLDRNDPNFQDYTVKISRSEIRLIAAVEQLIGEGDRIYRQDSQELPGIHFDRHLYQPLLVERGDKIRSEPPGLKDSERRFVEDMRLYCRAEKDKAMAGKEVYLLRNLSRGKGIGFFERRRFFPDFILWIKNKGVQRIVFIEPHGMIYAGAYRHDDKARLHETLPGLSMAMAKRTQLKNIALDSFIVSATPFQVLREKYDDGTWDKEKFAKAHILFPERREEYDYMKKIFGEDAITVYN